jgi:hypothetical protein
MRNLSRNGLVGSDAMDNEYNKLSSKHHVSSTRCALAKLLVLLSDLPEQI